MIAWIALTCAAAIVAAAFWVKRFDPLERFEPLLDEELMLLAFVDVQHAPAYTEFIRSMAQTPALQAYLAHDKELLEMTNAYLQLKFARAEEDKKRRWVEGFNAPRPSVALDHNARMILNRLRPSRR